MNDYDWLCAAGNEAGPIDAFEPSDEAAAPALDLMIHLGTWHPYDTVVSPDGDIVVMWRALVQVLDWDIYEAEKQAFYFDEDEDEDDE